MNNKSFKQVILLICVYIVSLVLGYAITELIRGYVPSEASGGHSITSSVVQESGVTQNSLPENLQVENNPDDEIDLYDENNPEEEINLHVENNQGEEIKQDADQKIQTDQITQKTPEEKVVKKETPEEKVTKKEPSEEKVPKKRKQTEAEITKIINNLSNQNYPHNVSIKYEYLDTVNGEEPQKSISNIRSYIRSKIWTSVTVTALEYDEDNNIKSITLRVNRPEE